NAISDGGFGKSLIQKKDVDHLDQSSMFFFNLSVSTLLWLVLFFAAPLVAWIYQADELIWLLRIVGLNVIIAALSMVQFNALTRTMDFRALLVANWTATVVSGVVGIGMALTGYGVWSLVGQMISMQFVRTAALWGLNPWRPTWAFSWQRLGQMLPFGSNLLFSAVLDAIYQNLFLVVIGLYHSKAQVGYYRQAHSLQSLPMGNFLLAINHVMFPAFARLQDDPKRLKRGLRHTFRLTTFLIMGFMLLLMVVADPLIPVLMSDKWRPAIPYLQLLCLVGILVPLQSANMNAFRAIGRSDVVLRLQLIRKSLTLLAVVLTAQWGVEAMIVGQIVSLVVCYLIVGFVSKQLLNYSNWEQFQDLSGSLLVAILAALVAHLVGLFVPNDWVKLGFQVVAGAATYLVAAWATRLPAFAQGSELARSVLTGRRREVEAI
ncbi:MAG TPA: lipopolysaccharide biosynthesis protein, partial [Pirellulaceae bacterium]|nr:lipopolysaccharide biosynthesis protein [Pirellulaceae bacterium]